MLAASERKRAREVVMFFKSGMEMRETVRRPRKSGKPGSRFWLVSRGKIRDRKTSPSL